MLGRVFSSLRKSPSSQLSRSETPVAGEEWSIKYVGRKAVSFVLITVTGGVALSALDDLVIYGSCTSKAMEKARNSKEIKAAIGEPIVRGSWYNASLAVAHKRKSVSCTFPVSGPLGSGVLQLKAVRIGDAHWFSYFRPGDWDILIMDALLRIPSNDERQQTLRISVSDKILPPDCTACTSCTRQPVNGMEAK